MAEAPVDLSTGDNLEQKILQVLGDAGGPVRTGQLQKKCQVPKRTLNQVLYRLKREGRVSSSAPATWCLGGGDASGEGAPAIPEDATAQPSLDEKILKLLEAQGPQRALHIAKALGMTTAKEVNPLLYSMRSKHLLSYDRQTWSIYRSGQEGQKIAQPGVRQESPQIIYQQNPINMICQQGANSQISIVKSEDIQIGHGNVMLRQITCGESGRGERVLQSSALNPFLSLKLCHEKLGSSYTQWLIYIWSLTEPEARLADSPRTPHHVPLPVPEDGSAQATPPGAHGAQHIHMDKTILRRVQLGHGNEMSLVGDPGKHAAYSFSGSPPVSTTTADPETSFHMQTPEPGPHPEGDTDQTVHIKSCLLEDAAIGNSNKMTIHPRSEGGVVVSGESKETKEETGVKMAGAKALRETRSGTRRESGSRRGSGVQGLGSSSEATPPRSCLHTPSDSMLPTSELRGMALSDSSPQTTEPVLREGEVQDTESLQTQD
ncbi:Z-DNA-binding protein 1 isoform X2 [Apodemus sylvaticus]|uniref:Z-DNA-binding protein 1 isoform X2 n=1 Tax=Apodemus sylvaticus TaxID=10129 RepID=UPI002243ED82|nr:Z-DNA-binding protein 1 isoform X2 [Apodemus sylvaticus]